MPSTMISRIDGLTTSVAVKAPIKIMTSSPITLFGEQTINAVTPDGTAVSATVLDGDRVGVNGEVDQKTNGIYVVRSTAWQRAKDFDGSLDAVFGTLVTDSIPLIWRLTSPLPVLFGTSNITFETESGFNQGNMALIESSEGYDHVGAVLPTGVVTTVKGFFNWILDRITLSTSGSASIVAAVAKGGKVVIKNGEHEMLQPAVCDYAADPYVLFPGTQSKRYNISGETPGGTILISQHGDYIIKLVGSHPITQNFAGLDAIGDLTVRGVTITTPNTDNSGGAGLLVQTKAYTNIYRYNAFNLSIGLHLDGVLTSTVEDVTIDGCFEGLVVNDSNSTSGPNAMNFRRVKIGGSTSNGARIEVGSSTQFDNLTIEGCGNRGGITVSSLWQTKPGSIAATATLNSPYYELNGGPADIYISHIATQDMIMNVSGGLFHRTSPTRFVDTHFLVRSEPGAGRVTVNLKSVKFHGSFGYVPNASFPYFDVGPRCEVIWDYGCQFSELTSMVYWLCLDMDYAFVVSAAGAILSGPDGFSCTKLATGSYRFNRTAGKAEFAKFAEDYAVIATSASPASNAYLFDRQTTSFEVRLDNGSTLIDAPFSVIVKRVKGYYS